MGSNKERVVVNHLGAGRLVVGVIEAYQSVPQKGSEQGMRLGKFRRAGGGLDDFYQIGSHLQRGVAVAVNTRGKLGPLTLGKERLWHFEFPQLAGQREQRVGDFLPLGHLVEAIAQGNKSVQRNQTLIVNHLTHSAGHLGS